MPQIDLPFQPASPQQLRDVVVRLRDGAARLRRAPCQLRATLVAGAVAAGVPLPVGFPKEALGSFAQQYIALSRPLVRISGLPGILVPRKAMPLYGRLSAL